MDSMATSVARKDSSDWHLLNDLRAIVGGGISMFRGWGSYEVRSPNKIVARANVACRIQRLIIPTAIAPNFLIHNINVGNSAQLGQPISAEIFSVANQDAGILLDPIAAGVDVTIIVEYVGGNPEGEEFRAALACREADPDPSRAAVMMLPLSSTGPIKPGLEACDEGLRILVGLEDATWQFEERGGRLHAVTKVEASYHQPSGDEGDLWTVRSSAGGYGDEGIFQIGKTVPRSQNTVGRPERVFLDGNGASRRSTARSSPSSSGPSGFMSEQFREPIMISLHLARLPRITPAGVNVVLFGVNDATSRVVFEVGNTAPQGNRHFAAKYALDGYDPWWWPDAVAWEDVIRP